MLARTDLRKDVKIKSDGSKEYMGVFKKQVSENVLI